MAAKGHSDEDQITEIKEDVDLSHGIVSSHGA